MSFTDGFFGLIDGLVVVTFIIPPVVGMVQSVRASTLYMLYLIPCLISMSFYVCFIPGYALARLWELTWGNKDTGQDAVAAQKKREYERKARKSLVGVLVVNAIVFFGFVFVNDMNDVPGKLKIAGYVLLLLPMGLNLAFAVVYFLMRTAVEVVAICRRGCAASEKARRLREDSSINSGLRVSEPYGSTSRYSSAASAPFTSADLQAYMGSRRLPSAHDDRPSSDEGFDDFDNGLDHGNGVISPRDRRGRTARRNRRQGRSRSRESRRSRRSRSRESHRSTRSRNSQRSHRSTRSHRNRRSRRQRGGANRGLGEPLLSHQQGRPSVVCGDPADTAIDWASAPGLMQHPVMSSSMPHSETRAHQHQRHGQRRQPSLSSPHGHSAMLSPASDSPMGGSLPSGVGFRSAPGLLSS